MPQHELKTIRPERMGGKSEKKSISLHTLLTMFFCVLVMHLGFAALVVYHDYVGGDWIAHAKLSFRGELPDSLWNFVYWFYIYVPLAFFLYGLWELGPLWSVFRHRKQIANDGISFHSRALTKNTMLIAVLGVMLMLMMWLLVLFVPHADHFGVQIMLIIAWGAALKIGWLIGRW